MPRKEQEPERGKYSKVTNKSIEIISIHHVAIICSDYKKSKKFYTEILGLKPINETFRKEKNSYKLDMQIGDNIQIELFSFPNPPQRLTEPESCGLRHLAFKVKNVELAKKELETKGVEVEDIRRDQLTDKKYTFFKDPDGLPLELYQE